MSSQTDFVKPAPGTNDSVSVDPKHVACRGVAGGAGVGFGDGTLILIVLARPVSGVLRIVLVRLEEPHPRRGVWVELLSAIARFEADPRPVGVVGVRAVGLDLTNLEILLTLLALGALGGGVFVVVVATILAPPVLARSGRHVAWTWLERCREGRGQTGMTAADAWISSDC